MRTIKMPQNELPMCFSYLMLYGYYNGIWQVVKITLLQTKHSAGDNSRVHHQGTVTIPVKWSQLNQLPLEKEITRQFVSRNKTHFGSEVKAAVRSGSREWNTAWYTNTCWVTETTSKRKFQEEKQIYNERIVCCIFVFCLQNSCFVSLKRLFTPLIFVSAIQNWVTWKGWRPLFYLEAYPFWTVHHAAAVLSLETL